MAKMKQLVKLEGFGNVQMLDADIPEPDPDGVVVEVKRSLISRGSELFRRYVMEERVRGLNRAVSAEEARANFLEGASGKSLWDQISGIFRGGRR